jgi:carbon storage regulator
MLVLSRKEKESIIIGDNIEIIIQSIDKDNVKIAIIAPKEIKVFRKELIEQVTSENQQAVVSIDRSKLISLLSPKKDTNNE